MPSSFADRFRHVPGSKLVLTERDPGDGTMFAGKDSALLQLTEDSVAIDRLQDRLYAEGKRALLVILQGIDTSGKDGTVRSVFNSTGPLGVSVTAFGEPTRLELAHDFLWRSHAACPRKGTIGIFNRSHYEDVLVVKVRQLKSAADVERSYEQINAFERMLSETGTTILKFMLHLSKGEQKKRLQERLDEPEKQWKFNPRDLEDRALWDDYQSAYAAMVERCSTAWAPWYVVPADHNWVRNAVVSGIVRQTLEGMAPEYPAPAFNLSSFRVD